MEKSTKNIFKKKTKFEVNGSLWMECDQQSFFGPGPVALLKNIDETGSINKAAMKMKMSYKKALDLIHTLNNQTTKPVVLTKSGGDNGGGTIITVEAKQLINYHIAMRKRFKLFLEKETKNLSKLS
jgi:molybdate transport system regulatory protein